MKKLLCLLLCLLMLLPLLAACGTDPETDDDDPAADADGSESGEENGEADGDDAIEASDRIFGLMSYGVVESILDDKGRLSSIYARNEFLDAKETLPTDKNTPYFSFAYDSDGKLAEVAVMGNSLPVSYEDGKPVMAGTGDLTVSYHENGSLHEFLAEDGSGYVFDELGRFTRIVMIRNSSSGGDGGTPVTTSFKVEYLVSYDKDKAECTYLENGEAVEGRTITMDFGKDGLPVKVTAEEISTYRSVTETAWTWENGKVKTIARTHTSSDGDGHSSEYTQLTTCTYDEKGNRTRMDYVEDNEPTGYQLITYTEKNLVKTQTTYAADETVQNEMEFFFDDDGKLTGYRNMYDSGNFTEMYDAEGKKLSLAEHTDLDDGAYSITLTRYSYDVPTSAPYDEIRYEQTTYYRADGTASYTDEYSWVYFYSDELSEEVDETTGESIWRNDELHRNEYGNCYTEEEGTYYFQKYLDADGNLFYFTDEGEKVPVTTNPAQPK